jgi:hypothetical protein
VNIEIAKTIDVCSHCYISKAADECGLFSTMFLAPTEVKDFLVYKIEICVFRTIKTSSYMCRSFVYYFPYYFGMRVIINACNLKYYLSRFKKAVYLYITLISLVMRCHKFSLYMIQSYLFVLYIISDLTFMSFLYNHLINVRNFCDVLFHVS